MNVGLWSATFGALVVAGLIGAVLALRPQPIHGPVARRPSALARRLTGTSSRTRLVLALSVSSGLLIALLTGWVIAVVVLPAAALGVPYLLAAPPTAATIRRLEAMEEWTRNLAGVLSSGVGLEQAVIATLRSTPDAIKPEVTMLVARLRARWDTEQALRAFADDLDDVTGDLIVANLILAAQRRNRSLANALQGVAESVTEDVTSRRKVEAVVALAPPTDLVADNERRGGLSPSMRNLFGYESSNITDSVRVVLKEHSPLTYVAPGLPPFLLFNGSADKTVPAGQTEAFAAALKAAGVDVALQIIPEGQHRIADWKKFTPDWQNQLVAWLTEKLGGR